MVPMQDSRFSRGLQPMSTIPECAWHKAPCSDCGVEHLAEKVAIESYCFNCKQYRNGGPRYSVYASIDAGGEDSTDPRRIADGTAAFNVGLPGVETQVGVRADGRPKLHYRAVTNNELATSRGVREYARRHNLEPIATHKRAIGGR